MEPSTDAPTFGAFLRSRRDALGYTAYDVAVMVHVWPRTYERWETGRSRPSGDAWRRLAGVLEVDVRWLRRLPAGGREVSA